MAPKAVIEKALSYQHFFIDCYKAPTREISKIAYWQPPLEGHYKLNVDMTLFFDHWEAGVGTILKDYKRDVIMAASVKERASLQPENIESLAILSGLQFCMHLGIHDLIMEFDCQSVVKELKCSKNSCSPLGNLFQDIKAIMAHFWHCNIHFNH